jgi:hypothetical protein
VTGVVNLLAPAPSFGQIVTLQSSNPGLVILPPSVTVVAGFNTIQFPFTVGNVTKNTVVTITGSAGGKTKSTKLTITP